MDFIATFQGSLVKFRPVNYNKMENPKPLGKRGKVTEFSRKSRGRMLELAARLRGDVGCDFITLTYPDCIIPHSTEVLQSHLRAFLERLRRLDPNASALWRIEIETRKSGVFEGFAAPHIHLAVFGSDKIIEPSERHAYDGWVYDAWKDITDYEVVSNLQGINDLIRTDHVKVDGKRGIMYYISKYAAKMSEASSPLVYVPYLHAGRFWGVFNKACLPFAELVEIAVTHASQAFYAIRRGAAKHWRGMRRNRDNVGFKIFCSSPDRWLEFTYDALLRYTKDNPMDKTRLERQQFEKKCIERHYHDSKNRPNRIARTC